MRPELVPSLGQERGKGCWKVGRGSPRAAVTRVQQRCQSFSDLFAGKKLRVCKQNKQYRNQGGGWERTPRMLRECLPLELTPCRPTGRPAAPHSLSWLPGGPPARTRGRTDIISHWSVRNEDSLGKPSLHFLDLLEVKRTQSRCGHSTLVPASDHYRSLQARLPTTAVGSLSQPRAPSPLCRDPGPGPWEAPFPFPIEAPENPTPDSVPLPEGEACSPGWGQEERLGDKLEASGSK